MDLYKKQQHYETALYNYQQAVADYLDFIANTPPDAPPLFVTIRGKAFVGTASAGQTTASTLRECIQACEQTPQCSGATFKNDQCNIRKGESPLLNADMTTTAIIRKKKQLLMRVESLNDQLIKSADSLEKAIVRAGNKMDNHRPSQSELIDKYNQLQQERSEIRRVLEQYEVSEKADTETGRVTTKKYWIYIFIIIIIALLVYIAQRLVRAAAALS